MKYSAYDIDRIANGGELQQALDMALEQIREGTRDNELLYVAARIAFDLHNIPKAEQVVTMLLAADPAHINGWLLYGDINAQKGNIQRSSYGMKRAEEIFPGLAQVDIIRQLDKAAEAVGKQSKPTPAPVAESAFETATFAEICVKQGYLNKALKIYNDLLAGNPGNAEIVQRIDEIKKKMEKA